MNTTPVAVYARISDDDGTALGVDRQITDCRAVCDLRGWHPIPYVDNDTSAYRRGVRRPRFEDMLADLNAGRVAGIVVYDLDRFARQPRDLERAIDLFETRRGLTFATVQGDVNLGAADGRTMARVMVAFANKASADTGRRVARKHLQNAREGKPVGGWRPFGWEADKATLNPPEAAIIRQAVADILAGRGLRTVAAGLNSAGVTTTAGKPWTPATLRQYLRNPRLVGRRTHRREVLLDGHGQPVRGQWEPLLDVDTWDRLGLLLARADRRGRVPRRDARHYLLTGLVRCGVCSGLMYGQRRDATYHYYVCNQKGASAESRHTVSISGVGLDRMVTGLVLAKLAAERLTPAPAAAWAGEAELAETTAGIDTLLGGLTAGVSAETIWPRVRVLEERREALRAERAAWLAETTGPPVAEVTPDVWDGLDVDQRRATVERLVSALVIMRPAHRGNTFDASRVRLVPAEARGSAPTPPAVAG